MYVCIYGYRETKNAGLAGGFERQVTGAPSFIRLLITRVRDMNVEYIIVHARLLEVREEQRSGSTALG